LRATAGDHAAGGDTTIGCLTCTPRRQSGQQLNLFTHIDAPTTALRVQQRRE
jgi:hypothetical protein